MSEREELIDWVRDALEHVAPGHFLLIEYLSDEDLPVEPYAQTAPDPDGWYCEVVSDRHLAQHRWPLDELALMSHGWSSPDGLTDNWWATPGDAAQAAAFAVDALWFARRCTDPERYAISSCPLSSGPDDRAFANPHVLPMAV
jgi:hypothetical protein